MVSALDGGLAGYLRKLATEDRAFAFAGLTALSRRLPKRFVIVTQGRAGSELLVDLLNRHPDITCDSEVLREPVALPNAVIRGRAARARRSGAQAYGFKLQPRQAFELQCLHPVTWLPELEADGWILVYLHRRNMLHQVISALRGSQSQFHVRASAAKPFEPVTLDPADVLTGLTLLESWTQMSEEALRDAHPVELVYEDDLNNQEAQRRTVAMLCERLGVPPHWSPSDWVKVQPTTTREMVANYDELAAAVATTRFAAYLGG
ncbi:MAG TPA: hypothetical protein VHB18_09925 [Mycobacteriales bacterium]|jgi:LPS sulfotransferase NodH|nr:hypothetical protein [Mycobacteriales bacterium]